MKRHVTRRFGGVDQEGRKLVVYAGGRVEATKRLRAAGVKGRIRRLGGKCVDGRLELPTQLSRGPKIDRIGQR